MDSFSDDDFLLLYAALSHMRLGSCGILHDTKRPEADDLSARMLQEIMWRIRAARIAKSPNSEGH